MRWKPPTVTIERDELESMARELRSTAALLPPYSEELPMSEAFRSVRSDIMRVAVGAAERIERLLQEAGQ